MPATLCQVVRFNPINGIYTMRTFFLFYILLTGFTMTQTQAGTNSQLILETSAGQIKIDLLAEIAPNHVARISELVKSGFYEPYLLPNIFSFSFEIKILN